MRAQSPQCTSNPRPDFVREAARRGSRGKSRPNESHGDGRVPRVWRGLVRADSRARAPHFLRTSLFVHPPPALRSRRECDPDVTGSTRAVSVGCMHAGDFPDPALSDNEAVELRSPTRGPSPRHDSHSVAEGSALPGATEQAAAPRVTLPAPARAAGPARVLEVEKRSPLSKIG